MKVRTLEEFYSLMYHTKRVREKIVELYLAGKKINQGMVGSLIEALDSLLSIPQKGVRRLLCVNGKREIQVDLSYEIEELRKDIYFLEHSEAIFYAHLESLHTGFSREIAAGEAFLNNLNFLNFITDRDGTVNNYCGRYRSSIQSVYNAVFLTRFALRRTKKSVIMTSAPLVDFGIIDVSVVPKNTFILAGSKGREWIDQKSIRHVLPIERNHQNRLNILNSRLTSLIHQPEYEIFSLIGSGLQFKFGQTAIARQDIYGSIPEEKSQRFRHLVESIVREIDQENVYFRIEDTGKDMEITLTINKEENQDELKDFDKGDGVRLLDRKLGLDLERGPNLVCGDTPSDLPMVQASVRKTQATWAIFVTRDEELKRELENTCPNVRTVSEPDVLVAILNQRGKEKRS